MTYTYFIYDFKVIWPAFWSAFTLNLNKHTSRIYFATVRFALVWCTAEGLDSKINLKIQDGDHEHKASTW